jgi:hypothetical protein
MSWRPNPGHLPPDCEIRDPETDAHRGWHAVHVRLRNGWTSLGTGPWPAAGGREPTRWDLQNHKFDIIDYQLAE